MRYQKLTEEQRAIKQGREYVYALATKIQNEHSERGEYITRSKALSKAWSIVRGNGKRK